MCRSKELVETIFNSVVHFQEEGVGLWRASNSMEHFSTFSSILFSTTFWEAYHYVLFLVIDGSNWLGRRLGGVWSSHFIALHYGVGGQLILYDYDAFYQTCACLTISFELCVIAEGSS